MNDRFLKTGVFLAPFHALAENPLLALERDMELLVHLDRLNYHEAWIGEHHSGGFEIIACPEMFIAAAAERTRHIRLGTGVVSLPYHNPFTVAGRLMQLDYMTRGRAMFGVGPGSLVYDAVKMGLKPRGAAAQARRGARGHRGADAGPHGDAQDRLVRPARGAAAAQELLAADDGDGGRRQPLAGRRAGGRPARHRHAVDRRHLRRGAQGARQQLVALRGERAQGRQDARPPQAGASSPSRTSPRPREQARADVKFGLEDFRRYFAEVATFPIVPPEVTGDPAEFLVSTGLACIGTPDDCIRHFERLWKGSNGGFGGVLLLAHNWADWPATQKSYELMARYVHPHFQRNANELRQFELRRRRREVRDRGRAVEGRRAGGDRQASGAEGVSARRRACRC